MNVFIIATTLASAYFSPASPGESLNLTADTFVRHGSWQTKTECEQALTEAVLLRSRDWVVKRSHTGVIGELRLNSANTATLERMSCIAVATKE